MHLKINIKISTCLILSIMLCFFAEAIYAQEPPIAPPKSAASKGHYAYDQGYSYFIADRMKTARRRPTFQDTASVNFLAIDATWEGVPMPEPLLIAPEGEGEGPVEGNNEGALTGNAESAVPAPIADTPLPAPVPATPLDSKSNDDRVAPATTSKNSGIAETKQEVKETPKPKVGERVKVVGNKIRGFVKDTFDGKDKGNDNGKGKK